ncbi:acetamidase/formamidase family protein, partial [Mycobacterium kansasii]
MPELLFPLDSAKKFNEQHIIGHNRWHPDIPPVVTVKRGDTFRAHCREWFDGAIHNDDSAEDILNAPLQNVHCLSGPFAVDGAEPGDLLIESPWKCRRLQTLETRMESCRRNRCL